MNISGLSKDELLSIIYMNIPDTFYDAHPCYCMVCKKDYVGNFLLFKDNEGNNKTVIPIRYLCDDCREEYIESEKIKK
jgi:hypothetical protein